MKKRSGFAVVVEILQEGIVAWDEEEVRFCCGCGDTPRGNSSLG